MKEITNILPIELEEAFNSVEFENEGGLAVCSVEYLDNEFVLNFSFYADEFEERKKQLWQLQVKGYRDIPNGIWFDHFKQPDCIIENS